MSESDLHKQKSISALNLVVETSNAAIASISSRKAGDVLAGLQTDQPVLHKDLLSLLSLIHGSTTKLSLALKPSSPTYNASLTPLKDLSDQISALSHCVRLFSHDFGITLIREVESVADDIIQSVRALCQTFLDIEANNTRTSTGQAGDEYMVRTGAVHDLINKARSPGGLPADNLSAVRKILTQDHASLEDALNEVGEMASDTQALSNEDMDDMEDDGWGELGLDSKKMDAAELERTKKVVHDILRLSTLLHKRVIKDILSTALQPPTVLTTNTLQHLDTLPPQSSALLAASDDLISTLYAPQDQSQIVADLSSFLDVVRQLRSLLVVFYEGPSSLIEQMARVSLQGGLSKDPKKWFNACFDQVEKAVKNLQSTLDLNIEK